MKLTKNTNKRVRKYVDGVLGNLGLVFGDTDYRSHYETIQRHVSMRSSKDTVTKSLIAIDGCETKEEAKRKEELNGGSLVNHILNNI